MDIKTYMAALSESKVVADFCQKGFDVFTQNTGKTSFDLIVHKAGVLSRVQVKSCAKPSKTGSYNVQLKSVRHNKTQNVIKNFDATSCDIVAVYLMDVDKIHLLDPSDLDGKTAVAVKP